MSFSFTEKKRIRKDFGKQKAALDVPDLLTLQVNSYEAFLQRDVDPEKEKMLDYKQLSTTSSPLKVFLRMQD